jgi:hypothetical protein
MNDHNLDIAIEVDSAILDLIKDLGLKIINDYKVFKLNGAPVIERYGEPGHAKVEFRLGNPLLRKYGVRPYLPQLVIYLENPQLWVGVIWDFGAGVSIIPYNIGFGNPDLDNKLEKTMVKALDFLVDKISEMK